MRILADVHWLRSGLRQHLALPLLALQQWWRCLPGAILPCSLSNCDSDVQRGDSLWPVLQEAAESAIRINQPTPMGLQLRTTDRLLPQQSLLCSADGVVRGLSLPELHHAPALGQAQLPGQN